ncbi:hypothetical protein [Pseudomonas akapageensis]|uniref:hypothetical protein n=1 Tax=Pseudomonas akapageensis TaxID=2609961 RepID=UPI00140A5530|nr:hypothetical protein [Pseudomonas akapageensis]
MAGNSKNELLERLARGPATFGWGAILAFDRSRINQLLQQQFLSNFNDLSFLLPMDGSFYTDSDRIEQITLRSLVLGEPRLSFESSVIASSEVTVTMKILAGSYSASEHLRVAPPLLIESFSIREDMGYELRMTASLAVVEGEIDGRGRVSLDLSQGTRFSCNLGAGDHAQASIGEFIERQIKAHPAYKRMFMIGVLDFNDYNPLSPRKFYLRTQAAPGATDVRSARYGDGMLALFIQLRANDEPGSLPVDDRTLPYLIPDDVAGGQPLYSSTLLIQKRLIPFIDDAQLDVLKHLLFPNGYVFHESAEGPHEPHDLAIFGRIEPTSDSVLVQPERANIKGGQRQRFTAVRGDGSGANPARWSVSNITRPLSAGTIGPDGSYMPLPPQEMGQDQQVTVVTAHYSTPYGERSHSALAVEFFQSIQIAPRVHLWGNGHQPVELKASSLGNSSALVWQLIGEQYGTLDVQAPERAVFTPFEPGSGWPPVFIQRIQVMDRSSGESSEAAVVILRRSQNLKVIPFHVPSLAMSETLQFRLEDPEDNSDAYWDNVGEGSISPQGLYTPPSSSDSAVDVILADLSDGRIVGYAIVELVPRQQEALRWSELDRFRIEALDGTQCYANGNQQIPLRITIETKEVDYHGIKLRIPLSDKEMSTLKLVDLQTNAELPLIDAWQEGIEHGSPLQWATHQRRNRFALHSNGAVRYGTAPGTTEPFNNEGTRYRELYIHTTFEGTREFYVTFQADDGSIWRSTEYGENSTVLVRGVRPPTPETTPGPNRHYDLVRDRAYNGQGQETPDDPFSYLLDSIDYWRLSYRRQGIYPVVFSKLEVEGSASSIQWESEQLEETFFSYTGYAFFPKGIGVEEPAGLTFDAYFRALVLNADYKPFKTSFDGNKQPSPGELIVSLHRVADMPYWHDSMAAGDRYKLFRERLDPAVVFVLLDEEGNRHRLRISFDDPSREDSRNRLNLSIQ